MRARSEPSQETGAEPTWCSRRQAPSRPGSTRSNWCAQAGRSSCSAACHTRLVRPLDAFRLHYEELTIRGSFHHTPATVRAALAFLASGAYPWDLLVTHRVSLAELPVLFADPPRDLLKAAVIP